MEQRLQKALAAGGVASRRHAEELIAQGRVRVDGRVVTTPGTLVDPERQKLSVDNKPVAAPPETRRYIALHKPVGFVSTVWDRHAKQKVTDLVRLPGVRLVPVGRLDADSEGLLLLSDDGDFIFRVTHPSQSVGKVYLATVKGKPTDETLQRLSKGLILPGEKVATSPAGARYVGRGAESGTHLVELTLHEGRNRQVRRMLDTVGHPVVRLIRTRIGPIRLGTLQAGEWRDLTTEEVALILRGEDAVAAAVAAPPAADEKAKAPPKARNLASKSGRAGAPATTAGAKRPPAQGGRSGSGGDNRRAQTRGGPQEEKRSNETGYRGGSRPGPGQDNGKPAPKRVQVHEDRLDGRVPPRGQRDAPDRRGGQGHRPGFGNHR